MIRSTQLGRNAFWMVLSRFGSQGLAVAFTVALARHLGNTGFGEYSFIAAILFIANALTTFGTDMLLIREIAAGNDLSRLPSALLLQLLFSAVIILLIWSGAGRLPNQPAETLSALRIYSLALIPLAFFTVFTTQLRGQQRMEAYMSLNLTIACLQVGAALIRNLDLPTLAIYLLGVQCAVTLLAGWICTRHTPGLRQVWLKPGMKISALLKEAAPIAFLAIIGMVYQRLGVYMLATMNGPAQTGIFAAASRIVEASKGFHLAVFAALYPMMAQAAGESLDQAEWRKLFNASWKILLAGTLLIALLLSVFAAPLIQLLYGSDFSPSAESLRILSWSLIPYTINSFLSLNLLANHREDRVVESLCISLIGLALMNAWWIPLKGPQGSAWAALGAETLQAGLLIIVQLRSGQQKRLHELSQLPE